MPPKKSTSVDEPLTERRFCELLELKLESMLESKLRDVIAPLISKINRIESEYSDLRKAYDQLQANQASQLLAIERIETSARSKNIIISGLQESSDTKGIIHDIISTVTDSPIQLHNSFEFLRLGSDKSRPRPVKVIFAEEGISSKLKKNAKVLRQHNKFRGVFINPDLPPATSKENARLRKRANELRSSNPGDTVVLRKGTLLHNDNVVDRFDISIQPQTTAAPSGRQS